MTAKEYLESISCFVYDDNKAIEISNMRGVKLDILEILENYAKLKVKEQMLSKARFEKVVDSPKFKAVKCITCKRTFKKKP